MAEARIPEGRLLELKLLDPFLSPNWWDLSTEGWVL